MNTRHNNISGMLLRLFVLITLLFPAMPAFSRFVSANMDMEVKHEQCLNLAKSETLPENEQKTNTNNHTVIDNEKTAGNTFCKKTCCPDNECKCGNTCQRITNTTAFLLLKSTFKNQVIGAHNALSANRHLVLNNIYQPSLRPPIS